jgi:hypothetical protein
MSTTAMTLAAPEGLSIIRFSAKGLGLAINLLQHTRETAQLRGRFCVVESIAVYL